MSLRYTILFLFLFSLGRAGAETTYDITKYGAKAGGQALCTQAIQQALDAAAKAGGGKVIVPAGRYLTGTVFVGSHTTLELAPGAVLLGSTRLQDYKALRWGHHEDRTPWHLIVVRRARQVRICGAGTIDGQGKAFWQPTRRHDFDFYKEIEERPSPMVELDSSQDVQVEGVRLQNSAGWTLHLLNCYNVQVRGLRIENILFGPNTDGIDVTGSRQVTISDCIINTGDDAIALKTTEDSGPCEYVTVTNCVLQTSCVAVRVGYESRQDFRHITVSNCVVPSCSRVIDIRSFEGAVIEHVLISGISGTTNSGWPINRVVEIDLEQVPNAYGIAIKEHPNYGKDKPLLKTGAIRHITLRDLDIVTDGRIMMASAPGGIVEDIRLEGIRLSYAMLDQPDPLAAKASSVGFFKLMPDVRSAQAAVVAKNITGLTVKGLDIAWPTYPVADDWKLLKTEWRHLNPTVYDGAEDPIRQGKKAPVFTAFWGRDLRNADINLTGVRDSDGKAAEYKP